MIGLIKVTCLRKFTENIYWYQHFCKQKKHKNDMRVKEYSSYHFNFWVLFRLLLVESLAIVIFYVIFLICHAVILNYFGNFFFQLCIKVSPVFEVLSFLIQTYYSLCSFVEGSMQQTKAASRALPASSELSSVKIEKSLELNKSRDNFTSILSFLSFVNSSVVKWDM